MVSIADKVLIVGGSLGGLTVSLELLQQGFQTTIYERRPNPKAGLICAGGISLWALRRSGLALPRGTVASQIRSIRIHAPNGHFWQRASEEPMAYTLWRGSLEEKLAEMVRSLGGTIRYNRKVGVQEFRKLARKYEFVVGADGITGAARKMLNLPKPSLEDIHMGVQRLSALPNHPKDRIDMYFGRSVAPCGYAWVFPVGEERVRVGLGVPLSKRANTINLLDAFTKRIGATPLEPLRGKLVPTAKPLRDPAFGNVLLVGDAGQFCDPFTGGGILGAVVSAKAATKAIAEGDPKRYKKHVRWLTAQNTIRYRLKRAFTELSDDELNELVWCLEHIQVSSTMMSLNLIRALLALALHKPRLLTRHKVIRRMLGLGGGR